MQRLLIQSQQSFQRTDFCQLLKHFHSSFYCFNQKKRLLFRILAFSVKHGNSNCVSVHLCSFVCLFYWLSFTKHLFMSVFVLRLPSIIPSHLFLKASFVSLLPSFYHPTSSSSLHFLYLLLNPPPTLPSFVIIMFFGTHVGKCTS